MQSTNLENAALLRSIADNLETCIMGKKKEIRLLLTALLAGGHVLLEDVPGTGKTVLIKALSLSIQGQFRRIQCNPDLLPTDVTGVSIYHPKQEEFVFRPGPVMTNILLVDEINRATTKTQSALLEAMEERSVTVDGESYLLPNPFWLFATQNPIDFEGTYSLPEAQLDRFMLKIRLGYPDAATEHQMVRSQRTAHPLDALRPVATIEQIAELQRKSREIHIDDAVSLYAVEIIRRTRELPAVSLGASPRATIALVQAAKAHAMLDGRDYTIPDDVKSIAPYVLGHRLIMHAEARLNGSHAEAVLQTAIDQIPVPIRLER